MREFFRCTVLLVLTGTSAAGQEGTDEAPPFVPTPEQIADLMLDMAEVTAGDVVYDLGSGDGRLVIAAAVRGARGIGIEYEAELVTRSRSNAGAAGVHHLVEFIHGDIFDADVSDADVVMLYLSPEFNLRLRPRLLRDLAPGARIVSHAFHMEDWTPDITRTIGRGVSRATAHLWVVPANVDGFWSLEVEGLQPITIELSQRYQEVSGSAWRGGEEVKLTGAVRGNDVEIRLQNESAFAFRGRLVDGVLSGNASGAARRGLPAVAVRFNHPSRAPIGPAPTSMAVP
jgi:SAM-dependent methyltransferase